MSLVCDSEILKAKLSKAYKGIPSKYRLTSLTKHQFQELLSDSFDSLPAEVVEEVTSVCFQFANTNTKGVLLPSDLKSFIASINSLPTHQPEGQVDDVNAGYYDSIMSSLGSDEVDMLRDAFIHMDMDSDGFVSLDEMLHVVRTVVGGKYEALSEYLQPIFIVADKDRDGKLSLTEFLLSFAEGPGVVPTEVINACVSSIRVRLTDEEIFSLQERFRKIDTNGDGFIDPQELLIGLKDALGSKFPEPSDATYAQILNVVMALADTDHDGKLSLSEFIRSFQEDQGVLPAVFIDTRAQNAVRQFTQQENEVLQAVFKSLAVDNFVSQQDAYAILGDAFAPFISDPAAVQELCDLIVASSARSSEGKIGLKAFGDSFLSNQKIPFESAAERVEKVKARLSDTLSSEEFEMLSQTFGSITPFGFESAELMFTTVQNILADALQSRGLEEIAYLAQLVISTGEIDRTNTLNCNIDAFITSFNSAVVAPRYVPPQGQVVVPAEVRGSSAPSNKIALSTDNGVKSSTYEGSAVRNDASGCPITEDQLRREFRRYDVNNNGFLDREEFKQIYMGLEHFGVEPTQGEVNELFSRYSRGSNAVSYEEFTVIMLSRSKM